MLDLSEYRLETIERPLDINHTTVAADLGRGLCQSYDQLGPCLQNL